MGQPIPARVLVPSALAAFVLVVVVVVFLSLGASGGRLAASGPAAQHRDRAHQRRFYTVRRGQTLSAIADRTGIPIERLEALNHLVDPQTLRPGQRLRLRR
jgi:LysM domain-containing protein